jgi:hypothetical protein
MKKGYLLLIALLALSCSKTPENYHAGWVTLHSGVIETLNSVYFTDAYTGYVVGGGGAPFVWDQK